VEKVRVAGVVDGVGGRRAGPRAGRLRDAVRSDRGFERRLLGPEPCLQLRFPVRRSLDHLRSGRGRLLHYPIGRQVPCQRNRRRNLRLLHAIRWGIGVGTATPASVV
ncbi:MAG: hypothetical protein AVDCRST_MAG78-750, partial [uncultured Rubrobacteraceae bacterium]